MSWVRDPLLRLTIHCNDEWLFDQLIVDISAFKNFLHRSHIPEPTTLLLAFSSICRMLSVYCALQVPENTGIGRLFTRFPPFGDIFKRQEGRLPKYWNISFDINSKYAQGFTFPFGYQNILTILPRLTCSWPILSLANQMNKKVYCPSPNWCSAKVKFFGWYDVVSQCAFSIIDLSLTQLAWVALTYNFVWPCQPTCKLIEWSSITCSQEKEREIKMKRSLSAIWWQIEECGGGQVRLVILMAYVLRKWK